MQVRKYKEGKKGFLFQRGITVYKVSSWIVSWTRRVGGHYKGAVMRQVMDCMCNSTVLSIASVMIWITAPWIFRSVALFLRTTQRRIKRAYDCHLALKYFFLKNICVWGKEKGDREEKERKERHRKDTMGKMKSIGKHRRITGVSCATLAIFL